MKDLDFDELDKAVTSLMGAVPDTDETVKPDDDIKTLVLTPSQPLPTTDGLNVVPPTPAPVVLETVAAPTSTQVVSVTPTPVATPSNPVPAAPPLASPAARRAGRFMDVVHPSSDMTKTSMNVSRHSGVIEPLSSNVAPAESVTVAPELATNSSEGSSPQSEMQDESLHAGSDWPDPLDMSHDTPAEPEQAPVVETESVREEDEAQSSPEPLTSPFLPDAKVDKRPLGSPVADAMSVGVSEAVTANNAPASAASDPQTVPTQVILPEELQGDLMAIESNQAETVPTPEPAVAPVAVQAQAAVVPPSQPAGPSSIQQQYKAEPSTGDQTNGSIYDTDSYHKPLEHPVKKKSATVLIIWIVVLLIIGAAGGAAAYFYLLK